MAVGLGLGRFAISGRLLAAGVAASMLPDTDVLAFRFGIPYAAQFGHRGFTHSLVFAALVAVVGSVAHQLLRSRSVPTFLFLFVATASHGVLDALTNGGLGVAFLWPFSSERYFAPIQFIRVAPLSVSRLLTVRGAGVLFSEIQWVWVPCVCLGVALAAVRRRRMAARFVAYDQHGVSRRPVAEQRLPLPDEGRQDP